MAVADPRVAFFERIELYISARTRARHGVAPRARSRRHTHAWRRTGKRASARARAHTHTHTHTRIHRYKLTHTLHIACVW